MAISRTTAPKLAGSIRRRLRVFQHDALDDIGDVVAFVGDRFEQLIDVLELDNLLGVRLLAEKLCHRRAHDMVRIRLEPLDFGAYLERRVRIAARFELRYGLLHFRTA